MHVCVPIPLKVRRENWIPESGLADGYELPDEGVVNQTWDPLDKQWALLAAKPPLQPSFCVFKPKGSSKVMTPEMAAWREGHTHLIHFHCGPSGFCKTE